MNAPVPQSIKNEAAVGLVDWLREKVALTRFFRYNAQAKHGVPQDVPRPYPDVNASAEQAAVPAQELVSRPVPPQEPAPSPAVKESPATQEKSMPGWVPIVLAALGLGTGAGYVGYLVGSDNDQPAASGTPNAADVVVQDQERWQSPLQYLEDHGGHLP